MTFKINNTDFSNKVPKYGIVETPRRVTGPNSGVSLDGTYIEDLICVKYDVQVSLMPLSPTDVSTIAQLMANQYVDIEYYSPSHGEISVVTMVPGMSSVSLALKNDTVEFYHQVTLTFKEK